MNNGPRAGGNDYFERGSVKNSVAFSSNPGMPYKLVGSAHDSQSLKKA